MNLSARAVNDFLHGLDLRLVRASRFESLLTSYNVLQGQLKSREAESDSLKSTLAAKQSQLEIALAELVSRQDMQESGRPTALSKLQFSEDGNTTSFEDFVRAPLDSCHPATLDPPVKPEVPTFGGVWTDFKAADAVLAGKVAIGQILPSEARVMAAFRRDGYVILPGAVSPDAIDAVLVDFERAFDGALNLKMTYWNDDGFHMDPADRKHLSRVEAKLLDLHAVSEAAQAAIFSEALSRFLHILFERPALAFQSLGFYYGSQQGIHQDSAFVRVNSPLEFVASWIALEDIQPGSGELEYYPGSHALPPVLFRGDHLWVAPDDPEAKHFTATLHARAKQAGLCVQRFLPKKGDVLIWAAGLMHGGSPVTNPNLTRKSLVTHYCPADLSPMFAYKGGRPKRKLTSGHYVIAEQWE
jgi:ectoine hydroxylase-related dioxygenase (phytanoyl-CoA dioxygenase family)